MVSVIGVCVRLSINRALLCCRDLEATPTEAARVPAAQPPAVALPPASPKRGSAGLASAFGAAALAMRGTSASAAARAGPAEQQQHQQQLPAVAIGRPGSPKGGPAVGGAPQSPAAQKGPKSASPGESFHFIPRAA